MAIKLKRIYDEAEQTDGVRILVDRLWPRGLLKENAAIDEWMRHIAPTNALRNWFGHKPERWREFKALYRIELRTPDKRKMLENLRRISRIATVTLLYAAKDDARNNAVALAGFLKRNRKARA